MQPSNNSFKGSICRIWKGSWINFSQERKEPFVTLQTAACRMASNPPSGASRLRDTICFCTSSLKRSTLSVSERMWRKPKVGTQLGKSLYLCRVTRGDSNQQKGEALFYHINICIHKKTCQTDFSCLILKCHCFNCCLKSTWCKCRLLFQVVWTEWKLAKWANYYLISILFNISVSLDCCMTDTQTHTHNQGPNLDGKWCVIVSRELVQRSLTSGGGDGTGHRVPQLFELYLFCFLSVCPRQHPKSVCVCGTSVSGPILRSWQFIHSITLQLTYSLVCSLSAEIQYVLTLLWNWTCIWI